MEGRTGSVVASKNLGKTGAKGKQGNDSQGTKSARVRQDQKISAKYKCNKNKIRNQGAAQNKRTCQQMQYKGHKAGQGAIRQWLGRTGGGRQRGTGKKGKGQPFPPTVAPTNAKKPPRPHLIMFAPQFSHISQRPHTAATQYIDNQCNIDMTIKKFYFCILLILQ